MASFLMAPSHCLNQCWLPISKVLWHTCESNFTTSAPATVKILHKWLQELRQNINQILVRKRHTYLTLTGELWDVVGNIFEKIDRVIMVLHCTTLHNEHENYTSTKIAATSARGQGMPKQNKVQDMNCLLVYNSWDVLLSRVTWEQSQPMREDVTNVTFSLIGWDCSHITGVSK